MYKIYADGELFCDSSVPSTMVINPKVTLEANTAGTFTFTITPDHPKYNAIQRRKTVISVVVDEDDEPTFQGYATEEKVDFYLQKSYVCEGELAYLNDSIQRQHHYSNETVLSLLTAYITNHNAQVDDFKKFDVGTVTVSDSNNSITCFTNYNSTMTEIKEDLVDDLGGYLRVRYADGHKYLDYLEASPHPATQTIELGVNLIDYNSNINDTEIATAIIPLGAKGEQVVEGLDSYLTIESVNDGVDYVYSEDAVATYGWIFNKVEWSNVTTAAALKAKAEAYLSDAQFADVTIEAKAIDLSMISDADGWHILDSIHVISTAHGMNRWFTLTKMELDLNNPENNTVTLGTIEKNTLTTKTAQTNASTLKKIEDIPKSAAITNAIASATNKITGATGGYICINSTDEGRPYEILIMDTDSTETAEKVWRWNQNGLGYSSTGYNGTYGLAITKDGEIVADYMTTGTLNAELVNVINIVADNISTVEKAYPETTSWNSLKSAYITAYLLGTTDFETAYEHGADINGDGQIDFFDLALITDAMINLAPWDENGGTYKAQIKCDNGFNAMSVSDNGKTAFSAGIHGAFMRNAYVGDRISIFNQSGNETGKKVVIDKDGLKFSGGETYPASGLFNIYFNDESASQAQTYTFKATGRGYWDAIALIRMNGVGTGVYGFHCAGGTLSAITTVFGNTGIPTKLTASYTASTGVFSLSASSASNTFKCTLIGAWL